MGRQAAQLAIVIPALNEQDHLPTLLHQLKRWREHGDEVIVIDGGSTDRTVELATPLADQVISSQAQRAAQLSEGVAASTARAYWFLHADSDIERIRRSDLVDALDAGAQWGWCTVAIDDQAVIFRIVERCMRWRSKLTRVCTGDQAMFVAKEFFVHLGGFRPLELMEDIDLAKRARATSKPRILTGVVRTSSRRWRQHGIWRTMALMWSLRLAWWLGVSSTRLRRAYDRG